jgi:D-serine deaminase-like pyridoxal phosphate-dependent protein
VVALPEIDAVATPALVVDRSRLLTNVEEMAERARSLGVALRPHAKTHKSPSIAALQLEHGAAGLTVATVAEAERLHAAGIDDFLITTPPVGDWRLERLSALARQARVRVALDDPAVVAELERSCRRGGIEIPFLWEVDCGVGRLGTPPGDATAQLVARVAESTVHCPFDGLLAFGGHAYAATGRAQIVAAARDEHEAIAQTVDALLARGIEVKTRSIGSTPTSHVLDSADGITEIRPGNYVFYDATQVALGIVWLERCALSVLATVVSRPAPDRLILDAGSKALAAERLSTLSPGFGLVEGHPELTVERLYEEHAIVHIDGPCAIEVGARVRVVPNHACAAVNLHAELLVLDDDQIVDRWPVEARGWGPSPDVAERPRVPAAQT